MVEFINFYVLFESGLDFRCDFQKYRLLGFESLSLGTCPVDAVNYLFNISNLQSYGPVTVSLIISSTKILPSQSAGIQNQIFVR